MSENLQQIVHDNFDDRELDIIIRKILSKVRAHYLQYGENANRIPAQTKQIIDENMDRL